LIFRRAGFWLSVALALLCGGGTAAAQSAPDFSVRAGGAEDGGRPLVEIRGILEDDALRGALESGLPLRFQLRVELWRKGLFDRLVDAQEIYLALLQDPLDRLYRLETGQSERRYASLAEAQRAIEGLLTASLSPRGAGRYYYLATLDIETLSLSDLEELRRWLRGDLQPAIEGRSSAGRAVERGLRRVFVRVIGLPTRRYEARSGTFVLR
jgi:hypothetical protein